MKLMNKSICLLLLAAMIFTMTACTIPNEMVDVSQITDNYHTKDQVDTLLEELRVALTVLIDENSEAVLQLELDYNEKLEALKSADATNTAALEALKGEYEAANSELADAILGANEAISALSAEYEAKIALLVAEDEKNAAALQSLTEEYEAKALLLSEKIAAAEADIAEITAAYETEKALIDEKIAANEKAISNLNIEYSAKISALESDKSANADAITALRGEYEAKAAELSSAIELLKNQENGADADYSEAISALESAIADNTALINANKSAYEAKASSLELAISANTALIETNKADYEAKNSALVKALDDYKADQAALSTEYNGKISALEAEINANATAILNLKSEYDAKLEDLSANASELLGIDQTLTEAGKAADSKAVGDAIDNLASALSAVTSLFEGNPIYGNVYLPVDVTSEESKERQKAYLAPNGSVTKNNATYAYTELFEVLPGDVISLTGYYPDKPSNTNNYASNYSMRMVCAYDATGKAVSAAGFSDGNGTKTFTVSEGIAYVAVTYIMSNFKNGFAPVLVRYTPVGEKLILSSEANSLAVAEALIKIADMEESIEALAEDVSALDVESVNKLTENIVSLNAKIDALDLDKLNESIESIKNLDTNDLNILVSATLGAPSISATAKKLAAGEKITLENNTMINNKNLTFTCDIPEGGLGEGVIRLGHGYTEYGASYIEVTSTKLLVYLVAGGATLYEFDHGLEIKDYLSISIDADYHWAEFNIGTATGYYTAQKNWTGRNGAIFAQAINTEVTNVGMRWYCEDYQHSIWMVGDSYFNSKSGDRWPSYLVSAGYTNMLMMSYPGMATQRGLDEVKQALNHGTPQYIVWCMGMNNGDTQSTNTINASYLSATEEFLAICEEKGITPILTTIPSTPTVYNEAKNAWVRDWAEETGGRYIDFSRAVSDEIYRPELKGTTVANASSASEKVNTTGYIWYDSMLSSDAVHPAKLGAQALFLQALVDFPEFMNED